MFYPSLSCAHLYASMNTPELYDIISLLPFRSKGGLYRQFVTLTVHRLSFMHVCYVVSPIPPVCHSMSLTLVCSLCRGGKIINIGFFFFDIVKLARNRLNRTMRTVQSCFRRTDNHLTRIDSNCIPLQLL